MQLVGWLQIASYRPPPGDSFLELALSNVNSLIQNLVRKQLVPPRATRTLKEAAEALELPCDALDDEGEPYVVRNIPMVDADQLLLSWMSLWGSWDSFDIDAPLSPGSPPTGFGLPAMSATGSTHGSPTDPRGKSGQSARSVTFTTGSFTTPGLA